jgi:hypothetical protein
MIHSLNQGRITLQRSIAVPAMIALLSIFCPPASLQAMTTYRTVHVTTTPPGATVFTNGAIAGYSPLALPDFPFDRQTVLTVTVSQAGYESMSMSKTRTDADAIYHKDKDEPGMQFTFALIPLEAKVPVHLDAGSGAKFFVDDSSVEADTVLTFIRSNSTSAWQDLKIRAERTNYQTAEKTFSKEAAEALPLNGTARQVQFDLTEISHTVELQVAVNVDEAQVLVNDAAVATAGQESPANVVLEFHRADDTQPWSKNVIRVTKDGYEFRPPAPATATPEFTTTLTLDLAEGLQGKLAALNFQPLRQLPVPWQRVAVDHGEVRLDVTNVLSAITPDGMMNQFNPHFTDDSQLFIGDRFGTVPAAEDAQGNGKPLGVVLAVARRAIRDGVPAEVIGSELVKVYPPPAKKVEQLTSMGAAEGTYDLQPCITSDGKYIYFSSNRSDDGQYHIFRIRADASRYLEEISHPQPGIDMEPTVFTDHDGKAHLAFTRYPVKSAMHAEPHIMVQTSEGGFAQVGDPGHSPVWSQDGTRIAYVSTKGKICIMTPEDGNSVELEPGANPAWLPGDKRIVFAEPNGNSYVLRIMDTDGSNEVNPIPDDSSFYSFPTVSFDDQKTYIYFVSNRQVQQRGDPKCWGLYYIEWKQ